jgi:hypothetical protein
MAGDLPRSSPSRRRSALPFKLRMAKVEAVGNEGVLTGKRIEDASGAGRRKALELIGKRRGLQTCDAGLQPWVELS